MRATSMPRQADSAKRSRSSARAVWLWSDDRLVTRAAVAAVGFETCEIGAVAGMAAVMQWRGDPAASPAFLAFSLAAAALLAGLSVPWLARYRRARPAALSTMHRQRMAPVEERA